MTDTVLQIVATGHEKEARNYAVVNKALASGSHDGRPRASRRGSL